ncbi:hypothetical protein J9015_003286 [Salmonella enterica]|uniref:Uncharacterized protein n=1 Tax=Obesumbacterium proteus ATCC 12841 TaxID=1354268 RepID=A0AA91EF68_9GAMM|nr:MULTISPECIES: hypothetical protein [Enterobacterales]EHJ1003045.1 hypothetical protein [Salmonella enterica]EKV0798382.1 hypothetical protein [Escherichia coli]MDV1930883.1 hypothetical protein [Enterobacter asburiae]OAT56601.1 hypothetical protein M993_04713 [Obesumbacterium proteus ATCC 12841]
MAQLTVQQLINQLRKMPPDALVIWKDHDHGAGEFNNYVGNVYDAHDEFVDRDEFDGREVVALEP